MKRLALAGSLAAALLTFAGCGAPPPAQVIWSGPPTTNEIAITFDAHYDVSLTPGILDALPSA